MSPNRAARLAECEAAAYVLADDLRQADSYYISAAVSLAESITDELRRERGNHAEDQDDTAAC